MTNSDTSPFGQDSSSTSRSYRARRRRIPLAGTVCVGLGAMLVIASVGAVVLIGCGTNLFPPREGTTETAEPGIPGANGAPFPAPGGLTVGRMRIQSLDGVFALDDAGLPKDFADRGSVLLAWWNDFATQEMFVFARLIETQGDVGHALLNLERDLEIDLDSLIFDNPTLNQAVADAAAQSEDATDWQPGTYETAMRIMGFPAPQSTGDPAVDILLFDHLVDVNLDCPLASVICWDLADGTEQCVCQQPSCPLSGCPTINRCFANNCNDGEFCNGVEGCSSGSCTSGVPPCPPPETCNEDFDRCDECTSSADCDDGVFCNGVEICSDGRCGPGVPPCPPPETCNEGADRCNDCNSPADCDDLAFCNGIERCEDGLCTSGDAPCPAVLCDEVADTCDNCTQSSQCDDNVFCNGSEICASGSCVGGGDPCPDQFCDENLECVDCLEGAACDDGDECTENDTCTNGTCMGADVDCSTADLCVLSWSCDVALGCQYEFVDCDDGDPCTNDWCNSLNGVCEHGPFNPEAFTENCGACSVNIGLPSYIAVNNDDDNNNGISDAQEAGPVTNENDLISVPINASGCAPGQFECDAASVRWHMCELGGNFHYTLFLNPSKEDPVNHQGESPWPPPATVYMEGINAWSCPASVYFWLNYGACCWDSSTNVSVVKVESLEWRSKAGFGNPALGDNCPNNGGKQIFPGKIGPNDLTPNVRKQVDLVATVTPPIPGVEVFFKIWDVDDPFDQIHGPLGADDVPNVALIDNNQAGPDNRPLPGEAPLTFTATTGANGGPEGEARVTVSVSMQPGNNYRAAATVIDDVFDPPAPDQPQVTQAMADLLGVRTGSQGNLVANGGFSGYKVPVVWSKMLTVWRKLHVEVDSMAAEPTTVIGRSPDWDTVFVAAVTSNAVAQTTTFTVRGQTDAPISYQLASSEVNHYEGGTFTVPGHAAPFDVIASRNVSDANLNTFVGEVVVGCVLTALEQQNAVGTTAILRDDDPVPPQLPFFIPIANDPFIPGVYLPAYIVIEEVPLAYNPRTIVAFDVNLTDFELQTGVGYDNSQDISSTNVYWTALLVSGFQPKESADYDADLWIGPNVGGFADNPDHDPSVDYGITAEDGDNASVIYVEVLRDVGAVTDRDISHITAHEIGHSCGPNTPEAVDHAEGMLMQPSPTIFDNAFSAQSLLRFRRHPKW